MPERMKELIAHRPGKSSRRAPNAPKPYNVEPKDNYQINRAAVCLFIWRRKVAQDPGYTGIT